ncbi:hypothetical protein [Brevundimonas sp. A19_0]|uniref:hypothetical protein n=1 Tax=Brevundimonas sp. A19_0 TaxID=2821087 RepID=UPI001ADB2134|nr:hypothetical protein [Brevundimonas sp. A19_0]MBO9500605.1 hypothetical protein [Brevundimonas sp. A19_0]
MTESRRPLRLYGLFAVASLITVALGCWICALADVATGSWVRNLIAWAAGAVLALPLMMAAGPRTGMVLLMSGAALLVASLLGMPQQGVHRWLDVGPLHINVALVVLPVMVVALAGSSLKAWQGVLALGVLAVLVGQPDASQATAFALAFAVIVARSDLQRPAKMVLLGALFVAAAVSWLRPDPLQPVPEVEQIVQLAWSLSPVLAVAGVLMLAATVLTPVLASRSTASTAALALSTWFVATAVTPLCGAFPVPWLGIGMSPIVGAWLGVGLLAARLRPAPSPASGS